MKGSTKEQLDIFSEAESALKQCAVSSDHKVAIIDTLASLFVQIVSEQRNQNNEEEDHAR